jgi:hypothetical protein
MAVVFVRTFKNSQFAYLYTCSAMMFSAAFFGLLTTISYNWIQGCEYFYYENEKCHGKPSQDWVANIALFNNICLALNYAFYYNGHFLFAYRYFEVAEMFGR